MGDNTSNSDDAACAQTPEGQLACCPELRTDDRLQALQQLEAIEGHYLSQRGVSPAPCTFQLPYWALSKQQALFQPAHCDSVSW